MDTVEKELIKKLIDVRDLLSKNNLLGSNLTVNFKEDGYIIYYTDHKEADNQLDNYVTRGQTNEFI